MALGWLNLNRKLKSCGVPKNKYEIGAGTKDIHEPNIKWFPAFDQIMKTIKVGRKTECSVVSLRNTM